MTLQVLMDNFDPEDLLFRGEQAEMIEKVFKRYEDKEESISINLVLIGVTGAGKTFTLNRILLKHPNHIYISASTKRRSNQIISLISGINIRKTDILLERTIESLKKSKKILIIDELNRVEDPKILFDDLNTIFRKTNIPIILITNNPFVTSHMEEDAQNTLFLKRVIFTRYSPGELRDICLQRIKLLDASLSNKMNEGTLNYICASASKVGSARRALNLVRGCYIDDKFDVEYAQYLDKQQDCLDFKTFINSMNEFQRTFLTEIMFINEDKIARGEDFFTFKDIQESMPEMNKSKISQLITEFEEKYGFIETIYVERGRGGGRYRKIFFSKGVLEQLKEDSKR